MTYPHTFEEKIGFDRIRELLKGFCTSNLGEESVDTMHFLTKPSDIERELSTGEEFTRILSLESHFPEILFFDVRASLERIRIAGTYLDEAEMFDLRRSLDSLQKIVTFFTRERDSSDVLAGSPVKENTTQYPYLKEAAMKTAVFPEIVREIDRVLDPLGNIQDHASPDLANIRRELAITTAGISRRLHILLKNAQEQGYVEKGLSPCMRDGRLVIPVSPSFKKRIRGIVHDESATGKTVYIEPEELVESNNHIRELEADERREIIRILTVLTDKIRPVAKEIGAAHAFMGLIDFSQAKARLANLISGIKPIVHEKPGMRFDKAIHPLLFLSFKKHNSSAPDQPQKVVSPLDIRLDGRQRIILISGPNAGGKSVCLKTAGLLQYMLQNGLMIPVCESSECGIFSNIFIDIGDEQSIDNDLSTYSSHLLNIKYFVRHADHGTLLLIDEFGSGTEPRIGGAIAQAALGELNGLKSFGIITTHYDNLKHFAEDQEGIVNGAMLYDRHLMQPLFRLETGHPGSSFAIEIARKIGLPESIIRTASDLVGEDYINMDKHLQDIVRDKRYWENKRQQVKEMEKNLERLTTQYDDDLAQVKAERKEILSKAREQAQKLLEDTNAQIENTIRGIRESQAEKEKTKALRNSLSDFKQQALSENPSEEELARIDARNKREKGRMRMPKSQEEKILRNIRRQNQKEQEAQRAARMTENGKTASTLVVGDTVQVKGQQTVGSIVEIKGGKAVVAFDSLKTRVGLDQLEKAKPKTEAKPKRDFQLLGSRTADEAHRISLRFHPEIDMRGMRADEAMQTLQYYLDDAIVVGAAKVRILHGTGTGALRQLVRQYVATVPQVSNYHDEHVQFGGSGITVVEFEH